MSCAALLQTHFHDEAIGAAYARLRRQAPSGAAAFIALHRGLAPERMPESVALPRKTFFLCSDNGFTPVPARPDTLRSPVKPKGIGPRDKASRAGPSWLRRRLDGLKPHVSRVLVRRWLATRWNPLRAPGAAAAR